MTRLPDDTPRGHVLDRREVLALFAGSAGAAVLAAYLPDRLSLAATASDTGVTSAATPSCIVRPAQTEGPYFVDERLERSDIRSDPSDGSISPGTRLTLAFAVARIAGDSCEPFPGVLVDVWHCDSTGAYSDVNDSQFGNTTGKRFLRGYQVTDAAGGVSFTTIYPGWYTGRTVHIHFKIRTDPEAATGFEYTSQVYFDDALTDVVHAGAPYAAEGVRTIRNADDGIYQSGGDQLLLSVAGDGAGGYAASFAIGVETNVTTTVTTTTVPDTGSCGDGGCLATLQSVLPVASTATDRRAKRTAKRLRKWITRLRTILKRAAGSTGTRRMVRYGKVRTTLQHLLAASQAAATRGTLGVPLAPIQEAIAALLVELPS